MPEYNASELGPKNTLYIREVVYRDGTKHDWTIPPFDGEIEKGFYDWMDTNEEARRAQLEALRKGEKPKRRTKSEIWSELLALAVTEPKLTAEFLQANVPVHNLEDLGVKVRDFFWTRKAPDDTSSDEAPRPPLPPTA